MVESKIVQKRKKRYLQLNRTMKETTTMLPPTSSTTLINSTFESMDDSQDLIAVLKVLTRREDEPQLNEIMLEMGKVKAQVDKENVEHNKAEEVARVTRRIFEEALDKLQGIAAQHVEANENAVKAATDALNAEKDLAQHDTLLSQARQNFDKLDQKYLAVQAEILKKAANCNQKSTEKPQQSGEGSQQISQQSGGGSIQNPQQPGGGSVQNPQQPGGGSTPCPPTTPCLPAHLAGVTPSGAVTVSANMVPQAVNLMPQTAFKTADANVASQQVAVPYVPENNIQKISLPAFGDTPDVSMGDNE